MGAETKQFERDNNTQDRRIAELERRVIVNSNTIEELRDYISRLSSGKLDDADNVIKVNHISLGRALDQLQAKDIYVMDTAKNFTAKTIEKVLAEIATDISKVEASSTNAQSMANAAYTDVVFEIEDKDLLAEYDNTTGIFTAGKAGTYAVSWMVGGASAAWDAGEYWQSVLSRNDSTTEGDYWQGFRDYADAAITRIPSSNGSAIVTLAATNTLRIKVLHTQGGAVNTSGLEQTCFFHIARIA